MSDYVFEVRSTRNREIVRRWLREILVFVALCSGFMFFRYRNPYENLGMDLLISLVLGAPLALALWGVYRVLRFALGR